jgi:hypothetical protein
MRYEAFVIDMFMGWDLKPVSGTGLSISDTPRKARKNAYRQATRALRKQGAPVHWKQCRVDREVIERVID